jgi:hypothetical protein
MNKLIITLFLSFNFFFVSGQGINKKNMKVISNFIECIQSQNKEKLSRMISFPLNREYPIPQIKNKQDFFNRYTEIFDAGLIKMIVTSKPAKDWSARGKSGLMLLDGQVWLNLEGKLLAVNYQSKHEKSETEELIETEKSQLHESMRDFRRPVCQLETSSYRIRIDELGAGKFRYASWPIHSKVSEKPEIVIKKGKLVTDGSGGNRSYVFKKGNQVYKCAIIVLGVKKSPPALLTVYRGDTEILSQKANIIRK